MNEKYSTTIQGLSPDDYKNELKKMSKAIDDSRSYRVEPIRVYNAVYKDLGADDVVINLMNFKGAGKEMSLMAFRKLYLKYCRWWWKMLEDGKGDEVDAIMNMYQFAVKNNYNIKFKKGDIKMRNNGLSGKVAS